MEHWGKHTHTHRPLVSLRLKETIVLGQSQLPGLLARSTKALHTCQVRSGAGKKLVILTTCSVIPIALVTLPLTVLAVYSVVLSNRLL